MIVNDGKIRTCGKRGCKALVVSAVAGAAGAAGSFVACSEPGCGKEYPRCDRHGGLAAARRSLTAHKGLIHPRGAAS